MNDIEWVRRQAEYGDYPTHTQTGVDAVDRAMPRQRNRIRGTAPAFIEAA
ncbi:hypothetical protein [Streptomyces sp. NPDC001415]